MYLRSLATRPLFVNFYGKLVLFTNKQLHMGLSVVPKWWPWMTLNHVIATIFALFHWIWRFRGVLCRIYCS